MPIISVSGQRTGEGPLTWGQRAQLRIVLMLGDEAPESNLASMGLLPAGIDVRTALAWIGTLVSAFDSMRTRIVPDSGDWAQVLDGSAEFHVTLVAASATDAAQVAAAERVRLKRTMFRLDERLVRFSLVVDGNRALALVWAASHLVTDLWGRRALDAVAYTPGGEFDPGIQPLERLAFEQSPTGIDLSKRAITHYRRQLELTGSDPFPAVRAPRDGFRFWYGTWSSAAMATGMEEQAVANSTTTASVLRAAINSALAEEAGRDRLTMTIVAANRLDPPTRAAVGSFTQLVPTTIGRAAWPAQVSRAAMANLQALQRGSFDPLALDDLEAELGTAAPDITMTLNDMRLPAVADPTADGRSSPGRLDWTGHNNAGASTYYLWVGGDRTMLTAQVMVDSTRLSLDQAECILSRAEARLASSAA
uniref:Condensation domain-containing protein n=1 Tax=Amycolatopsis sp. SANK 60206 TaxID=1642649 RepID=A0A0E3USD9_9PSEU|nr:hypothetical protein [Amycolatopsis sp. SANK 60206]